MGAGAVNAAVQLTEEFTTTGAVGLTPEHPPLHPRKVAPVPGVSVNVRLVPVKYAALQSAGHVIPAVGALVTLPLPMI